jgi:hypothetical protein
MDYKDGLTDAYDNAMGFVRTCATEYNLQEKSKITTQFNHMSVQQKHGRTGKFDNRSCSCSSSTKKGDTIGLKMKNTLMLN